MLFFSQRLRSNSKLDIEVYWHDAPLTKDLIRRLQLLYDENLATMLDNYPEYKKTVYEISTVYKDRTQEEVNRLALENMITRINSGNNRLLLARIEGVIVGFARVCPTFTDTIMGVKLPSCFVGGAATKLVPDLDGKRLSLGIGSKMAQMVIKTYQDKVSTITCCTYAGHKYNQKLYLGHGAEILPENESLVAENKELYTSFRWRMRPL